MAIEKALGHLADAERALEDCSSSLVRDAMSPRHKLLNHNRSSLSARDALFSSREQIRPDEEEMETPIRCRTALSAIETVY